MSVPPAKARVHACMLAGMLWVGAAILSFSTPGLIDAAGQVKGGDFVHFYTLGRIALERNTTALYDLTAQHQLQLTLVPGSARVTFIPVYPPQTALLFAPFALLPYGWAAAAWVLWTAAVYALAMRTASAGALSLYSDRTLLVAAVMGFPPFWQLVLHGQTTAIPLAGLVLGWTALSRERRVVAGLCFGLLALKPQLAIGLAIVALATFEGQVLFGAAVSMALQLAASSVVFGPAAVGDYAATLARLPALAPLLEPRPYQLHSLRAVVAGLPFGASLFVWVVLGVLVLVQAARIWRSTIPLSARLGIVTVATVLVSPHLTVYDATVLAPAALWIGGWLSAGPDEGRPSWFWTSVYWLYPALLLPTARFIGIQVSTLILAGLFAALSRRAIDQRSATILT